LKNPTVPTVALIGSVIVTSLQLVVIYLLSALATKVLGVMPEVRDMLGPLWGLLSAALTLEGLASFVWQVVRFVVWGAAPDLSRHWRAIGAVLGWGLYSALAITSFAGLLWLSERLGMTWQGEPAYQNPTTGLLMGLAVCWTEAQLTVGVLLRIVGFDFSTSEGPGSKGAGRR
jgi:hypothetical protein